MPQLGIEPKTPGFEIPEAHSTIVDSLHVYKVSFENATVVDPKGKTIAGFDTWVGHTEDLKMVVMASIPDPQGCRYSIMTDKSVSG